MRNCKQHICHSDTRVAVTSLHGGISMANCCMACYGRTCQRGGPLIIS